MCFSGDCFSDNSDYLPFQRWTYKAGSTTICVAPNQYSDTEYCLDFDTNLGANGQRLKIWQRYEGLAAQQLYITDDAHVAVENGPGFCVDVRAESGAQPAYARPYGSQKDVQTWDCFAGSPNQVSTLSLRFVGRNSMLNDERTDLRLRSLRLTSFPCLSTSGKDVCAGSGRLRVSLPTPENLSLPNNFRILHCTRRGFEIALLYKWTLVCSILLDKSEHEDGKAKRTMAHNLLCRKLLCLCLSHLS